MTSVTQPTGSDVNGPGGRLRPNESPSPLPVQQPTGLYRPEFRFPFSEKATLILIVHRNIFVSSCLQINQLKHHDGVSLWWSPDWRRYMLEDRGGNRSYPSWGSSAGRWGGRRAGRRCWTLCPLGVSSVCRCPPPTETKSSSGSEESWCLWRGECRVTHGHQVAAECSVPHSRQVAAERRE